MGKVTGVVANMDEKKSANGDVYTIVDIEGEEQGFFDWEGYVEAAGVNKGDRVKLEFSQGEYPRVQSLKKIASGKGEKTKDQQESNKPTWRDVQIARQCALKAAACLLQDSDLAHEERASELVVLAERLEQWVLR